MVYLILLYTEIYYCFINQTSFLFLFIAISYKRKRKKLTSRGKIIFMIISMPRWRDCFANDYFVNIEAKQI